MMKIRGFQSLRNNLRFQNLLNSRFANNSQQLRKEICSMIVIKILNLLLPRSLSNSLLLK